MTPALSADTQAILLLTAPLLTGRGAASPDLLKPVEYKRLARHLRELERRPADLIGDDAGTLLRDCQPVVDADRLSRLLQRGFLLSQAVERWQARAIWVVSRADPDYPRRLKARLQHDAPAVLYGCGDARLLAKGGLAVVGSRDVSDELLAYTRDIGALAARAGCAVVSGGARGVDQAAMRSALDAGGLSLGVLADSLEKAAMARDNRAGLLEHRLALVSPYDPGAGFNVGHAMQRNKLIYALADAALVVNSDEDKGGTWAGATEQLDRLRFVPLYVRATGPASPGLDALKRKGAADWPAPETTEALQTLLAGGSGGSTHASTAASQSDAQPTVPAQAPRSDVLGVSEPRTDTHVAATHSAEALFERVRLLVSELLQTPMAAGEVADALDVSVSQANRWLERLVDEGEVERSEQPPGFVAKQRGLFG